MQIIKMIIEYDGTNFYGWQRQSHHRSVQGEIEKALTKIYKQPVEIDGAGRTDAGVHALGQVATFKVEIDIPLNSLKKAMNNYLPFDIRIVKMNYETDEFHARYSALGKTYIYKILHSSERDVFKTNYAYHYPYDLDISLMKEAINLLTGYNNYESFRASGSSAQNPMRTIHEIQLKEEGNEITLTFTGDGFLYKMVRIMTAFLLDIGNRRIDYHVIEEILENPTRKYTSKVAPAQGLYLEKVYYKKV